MTRGGSQVHKIKMYRYSRYIPLGETPRDADSSAAGAIRFFHNSVPPSKQNRLGKHRLRLRLVKCDAHTIASILDPYTTPVFVGYEWLPTDWETQCKRFLKDYYSGDELDRPTPLEGVGRARGTPQRRHQPSPAPPPLIFTRNSHVGPS